MADLLWTKVNRDVLRASLFACGFEFFGEVTASPGSVRRENFKAVANALLEAVEAIENRSRYDASS